MNNETHLALTGADRERALEQIARHQEEAKRLLIERLQKLDDESMADDHAIKKGKD